VSDKRIKWGTGREDAFKSWIDTELSAALSSRASLERRWTEWLQQYRAPATQPTKHFPFEGASNYVLPVTAIDVDQMYAKFVQTIHAPANLWTIQALNPAWTDAAKPIQDFLEWMDGAILRMEDVNKRAFLELVKLGTCVYKTDWLYEKRNIWTYDEAGERVRATRVVSHPVVDHVRLVDFIIPAYAYAIQPDDQGGAPWLAERHRITVERLESIADSSEPYMPNYGAMAVQKIKRSLTPDQSPHDDAIQAMDYQVPISGIKGGQTFETALGRAQNHQLGGGVGNTPKNEVEIFEIHARFATQGKEEDDIVVEYHIPTQTIIRGTYLRYHHGRRPYSKAVYFPTEGFYGIGICEQKEMFQAFISDLTNFQHDNVLLSNSLGIAAKSGSNIAPGEPIYPGKIWITDGNPKEELMPFQLGSVYPSLPALISSVEYTGRQRTGVSDLNSGNINSLPSRTPATTVQSLLEEGARRPDLTLKDLRRCLSEVGLRIIQLVQQHAQPSVNADGEKLLSAAMSVLGDEGGTTVIQKLGLPVQGAEYGLGVNLTATSATANKEVAKQAFMGLIQLQMQTAPALTQLIMQAIQAWGTPVGQVALDSAQGIAYTMKRLFEQFDIRDLNEVVPQLPKDPVQAIGDPLAALQFLPPGGGAPQGAAGGGGMGALSGPPGAGGPSGV
jgi:hypothetical protein